MVDIFETAGRRAKRKKWASGASIQSIFHCSKCLSSVWGDLVHFRFVTTLYRGKG